MQKRQPSSNEEDRVSSIGSEPPLVAQESQELSDVTSTQTLLSTYEVKLLQFLELHCFLKENWKVYMALKEKNHIPHPRKMIGLHVGLTIIANLPVNEEELIDSIKE